MTEQMKKTLFRATGKIGVAGSSLTFEAAKAGWLVYSGTPRTRPPIFTKSPKPDALHSKPQPDPPRAGGALSAQTEDTMTNQAITFAMARLGDMPTTVCPCCGDTKDRDDMMGDLFNDGTTDALIARYGRPVCFGCADEHEVCQGCGKAIQDHEREYTQLGYVCADCVADVEREAALDLEHERQERFGWENAK